MAAKPWQKVHGDLRHAQKCMLTFAMPAECMAESACLKVHA
jgi:hypothetical protein